MGAPNSDAKGQERVIGPMTSKGRGLRESQRKKLFQAEETEYKRAQRCL